MCRKDCRYIIDDIICTWNDLQETVYLPPYPDSALWSETYNVEIKTVNLTVVPDTNTGERPVKSH